MEFVVGELPKLVSGILIAIVTAWLTVHLALRRFRTEQWWSRKADSYAGVFAAVHDMKTFLRASLEDQVGNVAQGGDRLADLGLRWQHGQDDLAKAIDMGLLLFDPAAVKELEALQRDLAEQSVNDFSWEHLPRRIELLEQFLASFRTLARQDLGIP